MIPVDPLAPLRGAPDSDHDAETPSPPGAEPSTPGESLVEAAAPADTPATSAAGPPGPTAGPDALERQRDEYYDLLLRKTAEFDNYRKRVERERRELSQHAAGEVVKDLLPIVDDLERALAAAGDSATGPLGQGVELVHRRLLEALARRGVVVLDPLGETFDPHVHEAIARAPVEGGARDGEIVEVFSRGYKLGERLLRPAIVKVATT